MKKKIIFMSCIIVLFLVIFHVYNKNFNNDNVIRNQKQISQNNKMLSIMLETDIGSDEYEISDETSWPVHTHKLNENLSYCENGGTFYYNPDTYQIEFNTDISDRCFLYFDKKPPIASETILKNSKIDDKYTISFSKPATTNEGLLKAQDGMYGGDSYYFRGDVNDNYVKFGDYYWRIIRINGDNSIRIIYDGTNLYPNGDGIHGEDRQIGKISFNSHGGDSGAYYAVGFKSDPPNIHGTVIASVILGNDQGTDVGSLNWWYKQNIVNKGLEKFIDQNGLFCNDRSVTNYDYSWGLFIGMEFPDDGIGSGNGNVYTYGARMRFYYNGKLNGSLPTLDCYREYDDFSKKNSLKGNNSLQYPIGLITADEATFAGIYGDQENKQYYLYTGEDYWTMSPSYVFIDMLSYSYVYTSDSILKDTSVTEESGVRPVLNLKADVCFEGSGTIEDPYTIFD